MSNFCTCCGRNHAHEAPCPPECVTCAEEEGGWANARPAGRRLATYAMLGAMSNRTAAQCEATLGPLGDDTFIRHCVRPAGHDGDHQAIYNWTTP